VSSDDSGGSGGGGGDGDGNGGGAVMTAYFTRRILEPGMARTHRLSAFKEKLTDLPLHMAAACTAASVLPATCGDRNGMFPWNWKGDEHFCVRLCRTIRGTVCNERFFDKNTFSFAVSEQFSHPYLAPPFCIIFNSAILLSSCMLLTKSSNVHVVGKTSIY
jgi:hypothetical protein